MVGEAGDSDTIIVVGTLPIGSQGSIQFGVEGEWQW